MTTEDFLFELGTEELPPGSLRALSEALTAEILARLDKLGLTHGEHRSFAGPRRLALWIKDLQTWQPDNCVTTPGTGLLTSRSMPKVIPPVRHQALPAPVVSL